MELSIYMEDIKHQLFTTPLLRVLDYLLHHATIQSVTDSDITKNIAGVKRAAVHQSLVKLHRLGVIDRTMKERHCSNILKTDHAWMIPFKIASNLLDLQPLVDDLKVMASKIILFGSRARGTNRAESDYDLLVVTNDADGVRDCIRQSSLRDRVQLVVKSSEDMLDLAAHETVFAASMQEGVILWQR